MKKALVIAALIGSSSVAMADSSFSWNAHARISFGSPVVVRDHRTPPRPVIVRNNYHVDRGDFRYEPIWQPRPIPVNLDCRNWDPTVERGHECEAYSSGYTHAPSFHGAWTYLGTRESAVPDNQFITVGPGRQFGQLRLAAEQGNPIVTKVAIRFMDNSTQVVPVNARFRTGSSMRIYLDGGFREINQIVVYTANGSRGTYSIVAH